MAAAASTKILDLLIIGGGLSGVMVAHDFHRQSSSAISSASESSQSNTQTSSSSSLSSWCLFEARSELGGRLVNDSKGLRIDLGGAWVWPTQQPNLRRLIAELDDIEVFQQPDDPSSTRIDGGAVQLVHSLSKHLPKDNIFLNTPVTKCSLVSIPTQPNHEDNTDDNNDQTCDNREEEPTKIRSETVVRVETATSSSSVFYARQVVIAVPPRLVVKHITFDPPLSPDKQYAMESSHTWMAGVTKISLQYSTRFWTNDVSNMGLPSHLGPAFQVYDASTKDGAVSALTFFALTKTETERQLDDEALGKMVAQQIALVWKYLGHGEMANKATVFDDVHVQRWPLETYISEDSAPTMIHPHPHPVGVLSRPEWNGMLLFAGSEADQRSSGVMEGAIGSAKRVMKEIAQS